MLTLANENMEFMLCVSFMTRVCFGANRILSSGDMIMGSWAWICLNPSLQFNVSLTAEVIIFHTAIFLELCFPH